MKKVAVAGFAVLFSMQHAYAEEVQGGYCKIGEYRVVNSGKGLVEKKLWEYSEPTTTDTPTMGWVDAACADRGVSRGTLQEFGKRIWFSVSGAEGAPASKSRINVNETKLTGGDETSGLRVKGLGLYGQVTPNHDCTYTVAIWQEQCK